MTGFESGYTYYMKNSGAYVVAHEIKEQAGEQAVYIKNVEFEIDKLKENINQFMGSGKDIKQLKGDVAEFWAAGSYNVNAAKAGSVNRAFVPRSNELGSPDVTTTWGEEYSLKFYGDSQESLKEQAKTFLERFKEYQRKGGQKSFEEYLETNGFSPETPSHAKVYSVQKRFVSSDQFEELKIHASEDPEFEEKYHHILELLCKKIEDSDGVSGVELTEEEARRIAALAKEGLFDPAKAGLGLDPFIRFKFIMQDACQAGLTSLIITMALKTTPELYKAFVYLAKNGEIDKEQFERTGMAAVSGAGEGFLHGALSAAIVSSCEMGLLGSIKSINPSITALIATLTLETIKDSFRVAKGDISGRELVNNFLQNIYIGSHSVALGIATQYLIRVPILGYMIGSFLGSVIAGFTYQAGYNLTLSFCVYSGFTMFGLVKQDYAFPEDALKQMGVEVFDYEKFNYKRFTPEETHIKTVNLNTFTPISATNEYGICIKPLRRGVIGVGQIGYIW